MHYSIIRISSRANALILFAILAAASASAADLTGNWEIELPEPGGVNLRTFLVLHQDGTNLTGKVIINDSVDLSLRHPHLEGSTGVFSVSWGAHYRVQPDGDTLRVTLGWGKSPGQEFTAKRVPESAILPPPALPLPALADLPANGLAQTPPMGWNSWNHFGGAVNDQIVRQIADAMVRNGMAAAGYQFVNIDDTWELGRDPGGNILPNSKFPDMKALADYVHSKGLKLGIYSSPGPVTCGGYEGSYGHEDQDARTFAAWGIDYLKYDWCSATRIYPDADLRVDYQKMGEALARCGRPIVYSLCEYGRGDVWTWGPKAGASLWRTTDDIQDNWKSMSNIGFNQGALALYAGPGHWNDPDMLEVGNGGMTSIEYKTHFSLWCILAAPLMAGNDLRNMSSETLNILTNREVIVVDQDALGKEGHRLLQRNGIEIWAKPLQNGSQAFGIFNRSAELQSVKFSWSDFGLMSPPSALRDLWQHKSLTPSPSGWEGQIPPHGVTMLIAN
jgi:alpha-galactosidase